MGIVEYDFLLNKIKQSRRKQLVSFLKEHGGKKTRLISMSELPSSKSDDKGLLCLLLVNQNIYNPDYEDFWVLLDDSSDGKEVFQSFYKRKTKIIDFIGCENSNYNTFDPDKQYVVTREKVGRPRRVLNDEEKSAIRQLREQGMGINKIAKDLQINNRLVMVYCRELV